MKDQIEFAMSVESVRGLIERWKGMARARRELANEFRSKGGNFVAISTLEKAADAYLRAASELEAVGRCADVPELGEQFCEAEEIQRGYEQ